MPDIQYTPKDLSGVGNKEALPLVTVIITAYNHARYLQDAIESVLSQTCSNFEIIVVDDGSTDNTREVATCYPEVKYIWQENRGLSAARNTGIINSRGTYLVFLDADDMLYTHALATNLKYFGLHPECGFISGWHDRVREDKKLDAIYDPAPPDKDHYLVLFSRNYIGMHAAVMYRCELLERLLFDESLSACEDHDMYLRMAKSYSVFSHREKLAAYRIHNNNMSHDVKLMLSQALKVLKKNKDSADDPRVTRYYHEGRRNYRDYYAGIALRNIIYRHIYPDYKRTLYDLGLVTTVHPWKTIKFCMRKIMNKGRKVFLMKAPVMKEKVKRIFGGGSRILVPKPGKIRLGDLRRTMPFSKAFGYDRGGPVDRYYIEGFLKENAAYIHGRTLEIGDNAYTLAYGGNQVIKSDILHIDNANPRATIIGDLSRADHIPSEQFDCIILIQTLHLIYDFHAAIKHCARILKPGGSLLLTVPGISQVDYGEWGDTWYWSFTGKAVHKLLCECFDPRDIRVQTYGNVLTATAFLYGMGQEEITYAEKDEHDPHYQVIVAARAVKAG
jgi:glycosyltransferase involved in cell wall biosynthesis